MNLTDFVMANARRGACTCGKCLDSTHNPEISLRTNVHVVNLTFFEVSKSAMATAEDFLKLVKSEHPNWLNGNEHNYLEIGAAMGDQGLALMTIGLGHLLGVWKALSPDTVMPFLNKEKKLEMAGAGIVSLMAPKKLKGEIK